VDTQTDVYRIELICQTKPFKEQKWQMELSSRKVGIRDAEGDHVLAEVPEEAVVRLTVPGFSSDNSNLGVTLGDTELAFKIAKQDLEVVRQYVDTVTAAAGHEAINGIRKGAMGKLVKGLFLLIICSGILIPLLVGGKGDNGGTKWLFIGAFTGLVMTFKGIAGLKRHKRLVAMRDEAGGL